MVYFFRKVVFLFLTNLGSTVLRPGDGTSFPRRGGRKNPIVSSNVVPCGVKSTRRMCVNQSPPKMVLKRAKLRLIL